MLFAIICFASLLSNTIALKYNLSNTFYHKLNDAEGLSLSTLGQRIRQSRTAKGMTQWQLAERLGMTEANISSYERDKSIPPTDKLIQIGKILNVSTQFLLHGTDEMDHHAIGTVAAHHDGEDWTEEELQEIERFKEFIRSKRKRQEPH